jgi:hypothetical protein
MAVTVGLLGGLGYVGIDAVLVPTPPRRFGGGVREPVEIPRKLAEGVRGERNIVLQRGRYAAPQPGAIGGPDCP